MLNTTITPPKTLNQWVSDGGNLWEVDFAPPTNPAISNYTYDSIKEIITDYFGERRIGIPNDSRFQSIWNTGLRKIKYQFYQALLSEDEYKDYSQMVLTLTRNGERKVDNEFTQTGAGTSTSSGGNNSTSSTMNSGTDTTTTTGKTDDTANNTTTNDLTNTGKGRNLFSDTPQSNVESSTSGLDTPVSWTYATNLTDNLTETKDTGTVTTAGTNTSNTEGSTEVVHGLKVSGSNDTEYNATASNNDKRTGSDTTTESYNETSTNGDIASIIEKWKSYLYGNSSAIKWLLDQLEPLFYSFYEDYE